MNSKLLRYITIIFFVCFININRASDNSSIQNDKQYTYQEHIELSKEAINLVHSMYLETLRLENIPSRAEVFRLFPFELCSRPCNYAVASFIVYPPDQPHLA
jgi:hypothetical protein